MRRVPNKLLEAPLTGLMAEVEASAHKPEWILGLQETVLEEGLSRTHLRSHRRGGPYAHATVRQSLPDAFGDRNED